MGGKQEQSPWLLLSGGLPMESPVKGAFAGRGRVTYGCSSGLTGRACEARILKERGCWSAEVRSGTPWEKLGRNDESAAAEAHADGGGAE